MKHIAETKTESVALAIMDAFSEAHCGAKSLSLKTALSCAKAALEAERLWRTQRVPMSADADAHDGSKQAGGK